VPAWEESPRGGTVRGHGPLLGRTGRYQASERWAGPAPRQTVQREGSPSGRQLHWGHAVVPVSDPGSDPPGPQAQYSQLRSASSQQLKPRPARVRSPGRSWSATATHCPTGSSPPVRTDHAEHSARTRGPASTILALRSCPRGSACHPGRKLGAVVLRSDRAQRLGRQPDPRRVLGGTPDRRDAVALLRVVPPRR